MDYLGAGFLCFLERPYRERVAGVLAGGPISFISHLGQGTARTPGIVAFAILCPTIARSPRSGAKRVATRRCEQSCRAWAMARYRNFQRPDSLSHTCRKPAGAGTSVAGR